MKNEETKSSRLKANGSSHKIQWLNLPGYKGETWNPIIGCSKISDGCTNCYAEKMAMRIQHMKGGKQYHNVLNFAPIHENTGWTGKTHIVEHSIEKPLHWKKPRVIFVCSMGDLFHESIPFSWIDRVYNIIAKCPQHIFIVLTKRPERILDFYRWKSEMWRWQPTENVWLGVTAENQATANQRIPYLNSVYAAVKFVSIEPMLSEVNLETALGNTLKYHAGGLKNCLSWVICGGESGHSARPMHPDWARSIRDQCKTAGVPFFFKQWGEWVPIDTFYQQNPNYIIPKEKMLTEYIKVGKHRSGNLLDGVKCEEYPAIADKQ